MQQMFGADGWLGWRSCLRVKACCQNGHRGIRTKKCVYRAAAISELCSTPVEGHLVACYCSIYLIYQTDEYFCSSSRTVRGMVRVRVV